MHIRHCFISIMNSMNIVEEDAGKARVNDTASVNETLHVQLHASINDIMRP